MLLVSHLVYLVQLLYLGKLSRPKHHEFSLKLLIFPILQDWDIKLETVVILFYLFIIQLAVYKRTITRFIADDEVVYQRVRRAMRLASDNSWTRHRLKHLAGDHDELYYAHLNGEWQFHAKFNKLIGAFLVCLLDWAQGPPLLRAERGLPLRGSRTIVAVLRIQTVDASKFQTLVGQYMHHIALADRDFLIRIASLCETFMILFNI